MAIVVFYLIRRHDLSLQVTGELLDHLTSWDALRAALPVGTVSGAPKVFFPLLVTIPVLLLAMHLCFWLFFSFFRNNVSKDIWKFNSLRTQNSFKLIQPV